MISSRCQQNEHAFDHESDADAKASCDGSIITHLSDAGAPDAWQECECGCHCAPRQDLIDRWKTDPAYREFLGQPLVIA